MSTGQRPAFVRDLACAMLIALVLKKIHYTFVPSTYVGIRA